MGTILFSRDGEGLYDHEGYVAHVLDDGRSAHGTWTAEIERRTVAWRAECVCGWAGPSHHSGWPNTPADDRYDEILSDWEQSHARPLLATAERVWQLEALAETLRTAERQLRNGVDEAIRRGATWTEIAKTIRISEASARQRFGEVIETASAHPAVELDGGPIAI